MLSNINKILQSMLIVLLFKLTLHKKLQTI
jgi:hypothetical protein